VSNEHLTQIYDPGKDFIYPLITERDNDAIAVKTQKKITIEV